METYKTVREIIADAATGIEERRSVELYTRAKLNVNWFDAVDGVALPGGGETKKTNCTTDQKRVWQTINDIP
jgi:hypothetical protein